MTTNLSESLNAVVLFGEHRFYGKSMPFGDQSFNSKEQIRFLTVDQTLMDYVHLIKKIKEANPLYAHSPVIAFGGSYGGMLAAWFRMKYPHVIQGAHASSAPILFFPGSVSPYAFNELVTRSYNNYCPGIKASTYLGFMNLQQMANDATQYEALSQVFQTCSPIVGPNQVENLMGEINNALGTMQMVDYPYSTDFLGALPANPVHTACSWAQGNFTNPTENMDYVKMLQIMLNVFQNYTGTTNCTDVGDGSQSVKGPLDTQGWDY
jgi:lysosomal Pro-X carboxypeptidase